MRLSRVDIKGFKSIAKKTVLTFPGQVTCIAGPNGCGKSNVIDAVRWALGEQSVRSLRAGSMTDVIFSGTQDAPPGGMARVTLEFVRDAGYFPASMEGFDTVAVARMLYRTGESHYSINDVRCRLKDVNDIFMDTGLDRHGYAIIEQGKIKDIIQSKPEDIRYLIEEAADVGRFRYKRVEALKRLEATSGNLDRVRDLLNEVDRQKNSLRIQAGKARRYQEYRDEINLLTRIIWGREILHIRGKAAGLEIALDGVAKHLEALAARMTRDEASLEACTARRDDLRSEMERLKNAAEAARGRQKMAETEKAAGAERLADIRSALQTIEARMENGRNSSAATMTRLAESRAQADEIAAWITDGSEKLAGRQKDIAAVKLEHQTAAAGFEQHRTELFDVMGQVRAIDQRLDALTKRQLEVEHNISQRQSELTELDRCETEAAGRLTQADGRLQTLRGSEAELQQRKTATEEDLAALHELIEKRSHGLFAMEKAQAEIMAKLSVLDRILAGAERPDQVLPESLSGAARVGEVLDVQAGYEEAVGRGLGDALDFVILDELSRLAAEGAALKSVPGAVPRRPHLDGNGPVVEGPGVIGPLVEYLGMPAEMHGVAQALTQGMWLVRDLECALNLQAAGQRAAVYVTCDGMILEPSGIIRTKVAMNKYAEVLRARTERGELLALRDDLDLKIGQARAELSEARESLKEMRSGLAQLSERVRQLNGELERWRSTVQELNGTMERLADRRRTFRHDAEMWHAMAGRLSADHAVLISQKNEFVADLALRQEALRELELKRGQADGRLNEMLRAAEDTNTGLNRHRVEHAAVLERIRGLENEIIRNGQEQENDRKRIFELERSTAEIDQRIAAAAETVQEAAAEALRLEKALTELEPEFAKSALAVQECAAGIERQRLESREVDRRKNDLQLQHKEQEIALKMSLERMQTRFGDELSEIPEDFDPQAARQRVAELQTAIEKMGQINFTSIEAHEEAQTRWEDLHRQYEDLVQASERLKEVIADMEKQSKKAFMATFTKVRANFQEIFATMFDGGYADLVLQEGDSMDAGLEIFACPPHKRPKAMSLLSEGEKTLCALSLVFALFKVKPSPFCIMDEVDAPLDDANVERLVRLIRSFSDETQFMVVTHNRRTMEMADIIYGVTFDVPGITKVVSMALEDVPAEGAVESVA